MATQKKEKPRHLGRGLEALFGPAAGTKSVQQTQKTTKFPPDDGLKDSLRQISVSDFNPNPYQPRTVWDQDQLSELAESIRVNGIIQPILARQAGNHYEIIAGERRLRAAELAGLETVPVLIRETSDVEMLELALVENIQRADLNPIEKATAYQEYISSFSLTQAEAAKRLSQDRSVLANHLRLLDLPSEIKQMLIDRTLSMGHARAILSLPNDNLRRKLANRALAARLSVREVERLVRKHLESSEDQAKKQSQKPPHIEDLEKQLRDILGTKISINTRKNGQRGKIIIDFYSLDEFDRLTEKMGLINSDKS